MVLQIVEKKRPLFRAPPLLAAAFAVEIDRERGDQIELPPEIGQRFVRPNRPHLSLDVEEIEQLGEERKLVDVQTQTGVPEMPKNEKKETAAATEVEDRERRTAMEFQVLRPDDVVAQPTLHIGVLGIMQP